MFVLNWGSEFTKDFPLRRLTQTALCGELSCFPIQNKGKRKNRELQLAGIVAYVRLGLIGH